MGRRGADISARTARSASIRRAADDRHHPARMSYPGTRPIRTKPPVTVFTTTGMPAGSWPRNWTSEG